MYNSTAPNAVSTAVATCDQVNPGIELRILPLGASIVAGTGSSDGNGFRAILRDTLADSKMEYVGTLRSDSMSDNYHEGHSGFTISQTKDTALTAVPFQPNVILLHVGTNDLGPGRADYNGSTQRLGSLLDFLLDEMPKVTILVCQLIGSKDRDTNLRIQNFNSMIPRLVKQRPGKRILVVDMTSITAGLLVDGIHPNDQGYRLMAQKFHEGIKKAQEMGWVQKPTEPHQLPDPNLMGPMCDGNKEVQPRGKRASRTGHACAGNVVWSRTGSVGRVDDHAQFVDMDGDGLDDVVTISQNGQISVWLNGRANSSAPFMWSWFSQNNGRPIAEGVGASWEQYRFADIDGDGKADMIIVDATGNMTALLNNGPADTQPLGWMWTEIGQISPAVGDPAGVRFADMTGDGKADLIWLDEVSIVFLLKQIEYTPRSVLWLTLRQDATHPQDMRLIDVDGDQKADAVWVQPSDGSISVWLNRDTANKDGCVRSLDIVNPPHEPVPGQNVMFGRIQVPYGRADYAVRDPQSDTISVWKNNCHNNAPGLSNSMGAEASVQSLRPRQNPPSSSQALRSSSIPLQTTSRGAVTPTAPPGPQKTTPPSSQPQATSSQSALPLSTTSARPSLPRSSTSTSTSTGAGVTASSGNTASSGITPSSSITKTKTSTCTQAASAQKYSSRAIISTSSFVGEVIK
ncbi:MAG: hypothetical protein Q9168_002491 [Polycauliona sp. 1 TL-2023]